MRLRLLCRLCVLRNCVVSWSLNCTSICITGLRHPRATIFRLCYCKRRIYQNCRHVRVIHQAAFSQMRLIRDETHSKPQMNPAPELVSKPWTMHSLHACSAGVYPPARPDACAYNGAMSYLSEAEAVYSGVFKWPAARPHQENIRSLSTALEWEPRTARSHRPSPGPGCHSPSRRGSRRTGTWTSLSGPT